MFNQNNIDLKIILAFTSKYRQLYERGEITEKQLNSILSLLDNLNSLSQEEVEAKLNSVFPD